MLWFWLILSSIAFAAGELLSKLWVNGKWYYAVAALACYLTSSTLWLPALKRKDILTTTGITWLLLAVAMTTVIGLLVGEQVSVLKGFGLGLAVVAMILLSL